MSTTDKVITIAEIDEVAAAINICFGQFDAPGKAAALRLSGALSNLRRKLQPDGSEPSTFNSQPSTVS